MELPLNIPPSQNGKMLAFVYYVIIHTQKNTLHSTPILVQLPFRVFQNIDSKLQTPIYDILAPVFIDNSDMLVTSISSKTKKKELDLVDKSFIEKLTQSLDENEMHKSISKEDSGDTNLKGSLGHIFIGSRQRNPINYQINKGDTVVAILTLPKTNYRLGETITATVDFLVSPVKCFQTTAILESSESISKDFALLDTKQTQVYTKNIHCYHFNISHSTKRINIEVLVPLHYSAEFTTSLSNLKYTLKLEFLVGLRGRYKELDLTRSNENFNIHKHTMPSNLEKLQCEIPIKVLPTDYQSGNTFKEKVISLIE